MGIRFSMCLSLVMQTPGGGFGHEEAKKGYRWNITYVKEKCQYALSCEIVLLHHKVTDLCS